MYIKDEAYKAKEANLKNQGKLTGTLETSLFEKHQESFGLDLEIINHSNKRRPRPDPQILPRSKRVREQ